MASPGRVLGHRRSRTLRDKRRGGETNNNQSQNPTSDSLHQDEPVDTTNTFQTRNANSGTNLAVSRGQRPAEARTHDNNHGGAEFDANTSRRGHFANLTTQGVQDLVTVQRQTNHDTERSQGQDPVGIVAHWHLLLHGTSFVNGNDSGERTDRVCDVIRSVGEGI